MRSILKRAVLSVAKFFPFAEPAAVPTGWMRQLSGKPNEHPKSDSFVLFVIIFKYHSPPSGGGGGGKKRVFFFIFGF